MQKNNLITYSAFKPFSVKVNETSGIKNFNYGSILIPVSKQKMSSEKLYKIIKTAQEKFNVPIYNSKSGFSIKGIDLGSNNFRINKPVKVGLLVGEGVNSYEAGEVWHLMDTRIHMPLSKIRLSQFSRVSLDKYTNLIMVSGSYNQLTKIDIEKINDWVEKGNTLITIAEGTSWAIEKKLVNTYHVYSMNNKEFLKRTFWFEMSAKHNGILLPQISEGITKVEWVSENDIATRLENSYGNIQDLLTNRR